MPVGQFGVDSCHVGGSRAKCGHQGGRQGGGRGVAWDIGAGMLVSCWRQHMLWTIGRKRLVIEMVVG